MQIELDQTVDWHGMPLDTVRHIAATVLRVLNRPIMKPGKKPADPWPLKIVITNGTPPPMVLTRPGDTANIRVAVAGHYPIQFCYQFSHERGHVLSNHWQYYKPGPFHWLEESICGSLSLVALKDAQTSWAKSGDTVLCNLASKIPQYLQDVEESECPLSIADVPQWFLTNDQALRLMHSLQKLNGRLSALLSDKFRASPFLIRSLQARNRWPAPDNSLDEHLRNWTAQCNAIGVPSALPNELARLFGVLIS
jgi:hypothetical protein